MGGQEEGMMAPFMIKKENGKNGVHWLRIFESIVTGVSIGIVLAVLSYFVADRDEKKEMGHQIKNIDQNVTEMKKMIGKFDDRIRTLEIKMAASH